MKKYDKDDNTTYENGYLRALEYIGDIVEKGTFEEVLFVKLKEDYAIEGIQHNDIYKAIGHIGGEYLEVCTDKILASKCHERYKFDIVEVYNSYKGKNYDVEDIENLKLKMKLK